MEEKEEDYSKSIGILADFNSRTGILAAQSLALNNSIYSPVLASSANNLINQYNTFSPIANLLPSLDSSLHSQVTFLARDANLAISGLTTNQNVLGLASEIASKSISWLNGIDSIQPIAPITGVLPNISGVAHSLISETIFQSQDFLRIETPRVLKNTRLTKKAAT